MDLTKNLLGTIDAAIMRTWETFTLYCGQKFNWSTDGYGTKRYEDLSDKEKAVADAFEGKDSYEDTFNNQDFFLPSTPSNLLMITNGN